MTKSRAVSGDPRKQSPDVVPERVLRASALLRKATAARLSDSLPFTALPPLALHALTSRSPGTLSAARCVGECLVLAYAYAELGIEAQVRSAELTVTDPRTGARAVYGSPRPDWQDDVFRGHTVVWLPAQRHLIDPAAERFREIAAYKAGPVIAAARESADDDDEVTLTVTRGYLRLAYTLASRAASVVVLNHPAAQAERDASRRRGVNLASEVVWLLANERAADETAGIPYPRAAALIDAARGMDRHGSVGEDFFFRQRGADTSGAGPMRLHEIPLPASTPEPVTVS
jgi:hypothetical protein